MNKTLLNIASIFNAQNYKEAGKLLQKLNTKNLQPEDLVEVCFMQGVCLCVAGKNKEAIGKLEHCIELVNEHSLQIETWRYKYELSLVYYNCYSEDNNPIFIDKSLNCCKLALEEAIKNPYTEQHSGFLVYMEKGPLGFIQLLMHLGVIYQVMTEYEKALEYLSLAKTICQHYSDFFSLAHTYDELGNTYLQMGRHEEAVYYYIKSAKVNSIKGDQQRVISSISKAHQIVIHAKNMDMDRFNELQKLIMKEIL